MPKFDTNNRIQIYGHRGARALSPENTIPAYKTMMAIGVDFIDMDINLTQDGELVVTHDMRLNPAITRRKGSNEFITEKPWILDLTLAKLKEYDVGRVDLASDYGRTFPDQYPVDGTEIPTLREVIQFAKAVAGDDIQFQIEMKTEPQLYPGHPVIKSAAPKVMAEKLVCILQEECIEDRVEIQAFDYRCLKEVRKLNENIALQFLTANDAYENWLNPNPEIAGLWTAGELPADHKDSIPQMVKDLGGKVRGVEDTGLTKTRLDDAKALGLKVVVWSLPSYPETQINVPLTEKLIDWGIDGFITDRPDIIRGLLAARGMYDLPSPLPGKLISSELKTLRD
ncbi:glycerophosphodiester phosphodiesterase family protein [Litoribacillus peritrichatus]